MKTKVASLPITIFQGMLSGVLAGLLMLVVMAGLRLGLALPTPTEMIFDRLFPLISIDFFLSSLGRFGGYTPLKLAGVAGALSGHLAVAGLAGVVYALVIRQRRGKGKMDAASRLLISGVLGVWLLTAVLLWPNLLTNYHGYPPLQARCLTLAGLLISYSIAALGVVVFFRLISRTGEPLRPDEAIANVGDGPVHFTRRRFAAAGLGALLAVGLGGLLRRLYEIGTFAYDGTQYNGPLLRKITPNDQFYSVSKNLVDPMVESEVWRVEIGGLVQQPRRFTLAELKALPSVTQETTLVCISYRVGGGLASNAIWQGVPLKTVLGPVASQADPNAAILFHAADGYYETFPYAKAMEDTTILAYAMNGADIPQKHGYPVRLVVPGLYGEKNCKWITKVEVVAGNDPRLSKKHGCGFYKEQGWGPNFTIPTHSFISNPAVRGDGRFAESLPPGEAVALRGVAIGGDRGISKVEVSVDDGAHWEAVEITEPGTKISWAIWEHRWTPARAGDYTVVVRATDGNGDLQVVEKRETVPQGSTGLHKVRAKVEPKMEAKTS